jgi:hypothetical protein
MKIPKISKCSVKACSYNKNSMCHAAAITVGGPKPCCDTFTELATKGGMGGTGGVGACRVDNCIYNQNLECTAKTITIAQKSCNADCLTFEAAAMS